MATSIDVIQPPKDDEEEQPGVMQVLCDPRYRKATFIGIVLAAFNQLSGLNALNFYSSDIFDSVLKSDDAATIGTALTGLAQLLGVCVTPLLAKKLSLKTILVMGTGLCTFFMTAVALFSDELLDVPLCVLIFILCFLFCFQMSQGTFFFTYVAEVTEESGVALANFTLFTFVLMLSLFTNDLFDACGNTWPFVIFAISNLLGTIILQTTLKDITGLSKQELRELYWPENMKSQEGSGQRQVVKGKVYYKSPGAVSDTHMTSETD